MRVTIDMFDGRAIGVTLPMTVELRIVETGQVYGHGYRIDEAGHD